MGCVSSVPEIHENAVEHYMIPDKEPTATSDIDETHGLDTCIIPMDSLQADTHSGPENAQQSVETLEPGLVQGLEAITAIGAPVETESIVPEETFEECETSSLSYKDQPSDKLETGYSTDVLLALKEWEDECANRSEIAFRSIMRGLIE